MLKYKMPAGKINRKVRSDKGKRRGKRPMNKVTAKGAYAKGVKNQMAKRRAPLVETKQRVAADVARIVYGAPATPSEAVVAALFDPQQPLNWRPLHNESAFHNIPVTPWLRQVQGLDEDQIVGRSIFSKYLKAKLEFRMPYNEVTGIDHSDPTSFYVNKMIDTPRKVYVVHGWVTNPLNAPIAAQVGAPFTKNQGEITETMLNQHIGDALRSYFDNGVDRLSFRERETSDIQILGYQRLKPKTYHSLAAQANPSANTGLAATAVRAAVGSIPNVYITCNWGQINRKVPLTEGVSVTDSTEPPAETGELKNFYPNNSHLPFLFVYNMDARMGQAEEKDDAAAKALPINNQIMYVGTESPDAKTPNKGIVSNIFYRYNIASWYTDS